MGGGDAISSDESSSEDDTHDGGSAMCRSIIATDTSRDVSLMLRGGVNKYSDAQNPASDVAPPGPDVKIFGHSILGRGMLAVGNMCDGLSFGHAERSCRVDPNPPVVQSDMSDGYDIGSARGAGPSNLDCSSGSSSEEFDDTNLLIDNISDMLKTCFRNNMRRRAAGRHPHKKRRTERNSVSPDCKKGASNRGNLGWLSEIIKKIPQDKKNVISGYGFSCCLELDCSGVPRAFAQWIADHVQVNSTDIILDGGCIHLSVQYFSQVTGLVNGGSPVKGHCEGAKEAFVSFLGLSEFPTIKTLGDLLLENVLTDDQYFVCFMAVYLASFLCPNSNTYPSTKYLSSLLVPAKVREYNWALFGFTWYITSVKKYLKDKPKLLSSKSNLTLGGCDYFPAVVYLDFVDFGDRSPHVCFPRIIVWKNDMIKEFSRNDLKHGHEYGLRNLKSLPNTCYGICFNDGASTSRSSSFSDSLESSFKDCLPGHVLTDICNMFHSFCSTTDQLVASRTGDLVLDVLKCVRAASDNMDTSKFADSSGYPYADASDSRNVDDDLHRAPLVSGEGEGTVNHGVGTGNPVNSESTLEIDDPDTIPDLNEAAMSDCPTVVVNSDVSDALALGCAGGNAATKNEDLRRTNASMLGPHANEYDCKSANMVNGQTRIDEPNGIDNFELDIKAAKIDVEQQGEGAIHVNDTVIPVCVSKEPGCADAAVLKMGATDPRQTMSKFDRMKLDRKLRLPDRPNSKLGISHASYNLSFGPREDELGDYIEDHDKKPAVNVNSNPLQSHNLEAPRIDKVGVTTDHPSTQLHNTRHVVSDLCNKENINPNKVIGELNIVRNNRDKGRSESYKEHPITQFHNTFFISNMRKENSNQNEVIGVSNIACNNRDKGRVEPYQDDVIINLSVPQLAMNAGIFHDQNGPQNHCQTVSKKAITTHHDHVDLTSPCTPDVEITGERIFAKECNFLSNQADIIYNKCLKPTSAFVESASSSGHNKNFLAPRRHVAPSHFHLSPYEDDRLKSKVTSHAVSYHATIVKLSKDDDIKYNTAIDLDRVKLTLFSFGESFKFRGRVDMWTMNGFCRLLGLQAPPSKSRKNYFFSTLGDLILRNWNCEQQLKDILKSVDKSFDYLHKYISKCDLVFIPCLYRVHWFVFVVDFPAECFIILDSYFKEGSEYHKHTRNLLIQNFSEVWAKYTRMNIDFTKFRLEHPIVPMQNNLDDCGIFCMKFLQLFSPRSHLKDKFSFRDINNFRVQLSNDMLFSRHNTSFRVRNMVTDQSEE